MNTLYTQALPLERPPTKVIVTEHEVLLGSAAALLAPPRETPRRRTVAAWFVGLRHGRPRHPRSRRDFTEYSRMAREMDRL